MKIFYSAFILLLFTSVAQAQSVCVQMTQAAVSPDGACKVFSTPCDVPEDWKSIPSCDLVSNKKEKPSLEKKMNDRLNNLRLRLQQKNAAKTYKKDLRANAKTRRQGTSSYRSFGRSVRPHQLKSRAGANSTKTKRTRTVKNYANLSVRRYYAQKAGYGDTKTKRSQSALNRPAQISSTYAKRSGNLKTTIQWKTLSKQHMRKRSYGKNPYSIKSRYTAKQKRMRDKTNRKVNVKARRLSGYKTWRGIRNKEANIDQELLDVGN